ncbi:MAG: hypothetical protein ABEJ42_07940 [Halobacteriaceae archaeon]
MRPADAAAWVGALASLAGLVLVGASYALVDAGSVAVYYGTAAVGPPALALFLAVTLVALPAGATGRADAPTVAGLGVVFGVVVALAGLWWAAIAGDVVGGLAVAATFDAHRWLFAGSGVVLALASAVYAWRVV